VNDPLDALELDLEQPFIDHAYIAQTLETHHIRTVAAIKAGEATKARLAALGKRLLDRLGADSFPITTYVLQRVAGSTSLIHSTKDVERWMAAEQWRLVQPWVELAKLYFAEDISDADRARFAEWERYGVNLDVFMQAATDFHRPMEQTYGDRVLGCLDELRDMRDQLITNPVWESLLRLQACRSTSVRQGYVNFQPRKK
jgi:hypothetical protein